MTDDNFNNENEENIDSSNIEDGNDTLDFSSSEDEASEMDTHDGQPLHADSEEDDKLFELEEDGIELAPLGKEMQTSFLEYSMSVIVSRALPDVRDGLKPVHRRILYAMKESGYTPERPHMKSARTVGDVIGKYHPHGDSAVYDAMVRLTQPFSMRVPLIDGHGNFGSIDGDKAAAMRYTEARLDKAANELLRDLDKETVDFQPNYDESLQEPKVLPARFPSLLVNGSSGIAVGMATNIPPHNLGETIDATCMLIDNPEATTEELMEVMPGPDFPTGATIMGRDGIKSAYETGHGSITIRSKCEIVEKKGNRHSIVVSEIPYQVNRQKLLERFGELIRDKKLPEISNVHDGADRHGIDIIIDLKQGSIPQVVLNKLYKHTNLQVGFGVNMLALVDGVPRVLSVKTALSHYIAHQKEVVTRRTQFDLKKAEERAHILNGLIIALDNIDEVIKVIRASQTDAEATKNLMDRFGLSKKQTAAILEMKLRRLTGLERDKIQTELDELLERIAYYRSLLADEKLILGVIKEEMQEIRKKFNTPRRTKITNATKDLDVEDLIAEAEMVVTVTNAGYIKRLPSNAYRQQKRGGKGTQGVNLKDQDYVKHMFVASTHAYMMFFSTKGKVYKLKVYQVPEASKQARGTAIVNLLPLEKGESISAIIATKDFPNTEYLIFGTAHGMVKKTSMDLYSKVRSGGMAAINLREGDTLIAVKRVTAGQKVVMVSSSGKAIVWDEREARPMGRATMGVKGMRVDSGNKVLNLETASDDDGLFVITERGYGKRTSVKDYRVSHRGGQGVLTITMTKKKGQLVDAKIVQDTDELMIISKEGVVVKTAVQGISQLGRNTQGVRVMNVADTDQVITLAVSPEDNNAQGKPEEAAEDAPTSLFD